MELVKIENVNGLNVVSSRVVAEALGKEHKRVMQDCREKLEDGVEFVQSSYVNSQNKTQPELLLTKDGFILLCMNYQGYNDFKRAYINKFNEMEKELTQIDHKRALLADLFSDDKMTVVNAHKSLIELETKPLVEKLEYQAPKVEYFDKVLNSNKLINISSIAKDLGISGMELNNILQEKKIQYKQGKHWVLYSKYQDRIPEYADYVISEYGQILKWTEFGRKWIMELLEEDKQKGSN